MLKELKSHKSAITIAVISSAIFLYIVQPVLEFVGIFVVDFGTKIGAGYVDTVFEQSSHLEIMSFGFFFYAIASCLIAGFLSGFVASLWIPYRKVERESEQVSKSRIIPTIGSVIAVFVIIGLLATKQYQLSIITSFKQHSRIIAPYIDSQREELILSQWSLMKNRKDYESIVSEIKNIASENGINLPDNKLYSLSSI